MECDIAHMSNSENDFFFFFIVFCMLHQFDVETLEFVKHQSVHVNIWPLIPVKSVNLLQQLDL